MSKRWFDPVSRRSFLRGAGQFSLALPFLPSILPKALAATTPPLRFVMMYNQYTPSPTIFYRPYFPNRDNGGAIGWDQDQIPGMTRYSDHVYYKKMTDTDFKFFQLNGILGANFDAIKAKINIHQGLDGMTGNGHTPCLGPTAGPDDFIDGHEHVPLFPYSIDRVIEIAPSMYQGMNPRVKAIRVAPGPETFYDNASYDLTNGAVNYLFYDNSAQAVFDRIFGTTTSAPSGTVPPEKKVVDRVLEDYKSLMADRSTSSDDKKIVSNLMDLLNEIQNSFQQTSTGTSGGCSPVTLNTPKTNADYYVNHFKIITAAFACDLTRVASIVVMDHADSGRLASNKYHDEYGHADTVLAEQAYGWKYNQFAVLAKQLDQVLEGNGKTILDNSVCSFLGGANGPWHSGFILPTMTAGSAGGKLRSGYWMDYRYRPFVAISHAVNNGFYGYVGRPLNQLHTTIFAALGIPPSEYQRNGKEGFGNYDFSTVEAVRLIAKTSPNPTITNQMLNASTHYGQFFPNGRNVSLPFFAI